MNKYITSNHFDRHFCTHLYSKKNYYSLFDITRLRNLNTSSNFFALKLGMLECFVNDLILNDDTPFERSYSTNKYEPTSLAIQYFACLPDFVTVVNILSPRYEYSERINVFIECCSSMGLLIGALKWGNLYLGPQKINHHLGGVTAAEIFNTLVKKIRGKWKSNNIQAKVNKRIGDANDCYKDYCDYVDSLFEFRAKILVVRFDLIYAPQYADIATIFDMRNDLNHLIENMPNNSLFDFKIGYIAKIEYGADKGIHCHVILFYDGSERNNSSHIHLANKIGEYWVHVITKGRGYYYNINNNIDHYDKLGRCGIGVIKWDNDRLRKNLKEYVVQYLCKVDQFIKPKFGGKVRLIRRGKFPKIPVNKLGRPRKESESFTAHELVYEKIIP